MLSGWESEGAAFAGLGTRSCYSLLILFPVNFPASREFDLGKFRREIPCSESRTAFSRRMIELSGRREFGMRNQSSSGGVGGVLSWMKNAASFGAGIV